VTSDMKMTLSVMYSCEKCGLKRVSVPVRTREADEDVVHWVEVAVGSAIGDDHQSRSPHCRVSTMSEVMIPVTGADRVGDPAKN
jgi:hypothetical protein